MASFTPYLCIILIQLANGGSNILCKLALEQGLSYLVFIIYRHAIALAIFGPLAFVFERKERPRLTKSIVLKIFVLSLFGTTIHLNAYYAGLDYTSATITTALINLIPALTFTLAVILRMEKVNIREVKGRAKVFGVLICISGALIFTFWKGKLLGGITDKALIKVGGNDSTRHVEDDHIKGTMLLLLSFIAFSVWLIMQKIVFDVYPAKLSTNAMICFFATLQSSALAIVFERNASSWKLGWNIQLVSLLYTGIISSCISYYLQTYCVSKKGPVFTAMFFPLIFVIVALFSAVFFAEKLHLGSLIGAIIIIIGLYIVLWGKSENSAKDEKEKSKMQGIGLQKSIERSSTVINESVVVEV